MEKPYVPQAPSQPQQKTAPDARSSAGVNGGRSGKGVAFERERENMFNSGHLTVKSIHRRERQGPGWEGMRKATERAAARLA